MVFETIRFGRSRIPPPANLRAGRDGQRFDGGPRQPFRRAAKKSWSNAPHSSARTPGRTQDS